MIFAPEPQLTASAHTQEWKMASVRRERCWRRAAHRCVWIQRSAGLLIHIFSCSYKRRGWRSVFQHQFGKVFSITLFLSKNGLLTGSIFKISCPEFELGHMFVGDVGQLHLQMQSYWTGMDGWMVRDRKGWCGVFLSELTESMFALWSLQILWTYHRVTQCTSL